MTTLERRPDHLQAIGQWTDAQHLEAIRREGGREHWIIERDASPAGYLIAYDRRAQGAGIYVKRILVDAKERGTGKAALRIYLELAFARPGTQVVWLIVRNDNSRARAVYESLGFERFEPGGEAAAFYDAVAEAPPEKCFRMRFSRPG